MSMKDFISEIISRTRNEKAKLVEAVTAGTNIHSFDDYQYLIGQIDGLRVALEIVDEILTEDEEAE